MSNDNRLWMWVGGAIACLLVAGIGLKQCGSSSQQEVVSEETARAIELASRNDAAGWSVASEGRSGGGSDVGGSRRSGGAGPGGRGSDSGTGASASSGGSAQAVHDDLRRRQQGSGGGAGARTKPGAVDALGSAGGRDDPFKEARERIASRSQGAAGAAPLAVPAASGVAPVIEDPTNGEPSETPALSILAKEGEARDDAAIVDSNTATYQAGEGHVFDTESQVRIPNAGNITGDAGSIAFELKPKWEGADNSDASLFDLRTPNVWNNRMELVKNGQYLRFLMWDDQGNENGVAFQMKNWAPDEAHPVAVTWGADENGQRVMSLYVDGALVGQKAYENDFNVPNGQPLVIGNNAGGALGANSVLNGFQVYNKPLDQGRIGTLSYGAQK